MRQPNLTHYSFPKQLLSKSLLCPMFFPFKSHQNPWWCLRSQNMTCHPMTKHLDQVFACLTNALTFLQPSPYLFPLFSRNIPTSFPDHSQFCTLCPYSFPNIFPCFSQIIPSFVPTPLVFFNSCFSKLRPTVSQIVFRFGYMSSLEHPWTRFLRAKKQADSWLFPWKS